MIEIHLSIESIIQLSAAISAVASTVYAILQVKNLKKENRELKEITRPLKRARTVAKHKEE